MRWLLAFLLPILFFFLPNSAVCQSQEDLGQVIAVAFEYPCFTDFLVSNQTGKDLLLGISTNNQIPQSTIIPSIHQTVPLLSRFAKKQEPRFWVRMEKVRLRSHAAKVFFVYDKTVKAKIWLQFKEGEWQVSRSIVRQKVKSKSGKQGSRFCMSF